MRIRYRELHATDWAWMMVAAAVLLGCPDDGTGDYTPSATPTPTASATPTSPMSPTPTATPTPTPSGTPTAPPTGTPTAPPTGTPTGGPGEFLFTLDDFSFDHEVGVTLCPQDIGDIEIENLTDTIASVTTSKQPAIAAFINIVPSNTTVPAGGNATLDVQFNCGMTSNFSGSLSVDADNGSLSDGDSGTVISNIFGS